MDADITTDVLIVGAGPAGGSMSALLATYGVSTLTIAKHPRTAQTPRAHITNQRAMEVLRDLGLEEACLHQSSPGEYMGQTLWMESFVGAEYARTYAWGQDPMRKGDYDTASPARMVDLPQSLLEPILIDAATDRGAKVRFSTELVSFEQDADGVTALARGNMTGREFRIRSRYLIGADGARSRVIEQLGFRMQGQSDLAYAFNVYCEVDLTPYVEHRPGALYWIYDLNAPLWALVANFRMVRPWNQWLVTFISFAGKADVPSSDEVLSRLRALIGLPDIPIKIHSTFRWGFNDLVAENYGRGRVFCVGDAVHRHPPGNGLGSNTSIQDSYNLAWKLALVLAGKAEPGLLDSYEAERRPIGQQIVKRANKSMDQSEIWALLGVRPELSPEARASELARLSLPTEDGRARRAELRKWIEARQYELHANGVELNQRYQSRAIVPDGSADPGFARDVELFYQPSTRPGAHLPHAWVGRGESPHSRLSTLDLAGRGALSLFTGTGGEAWAEAAKQVSGEFGVEIASRLIGPSLEFKDLYGDWARLSEIEDEGCLLVRPDMFVAWRNKTLVADPYSALRSAVGQILGKA